MLPLILRVFGQCEGCDEVDLGKGCGGFLLPTLTTSVVGFGGPNAKSRTRAPWWSGGSVPFRGVGVRVEARWGSCGCETEMVLFLRERCGGLLRVGRGANNFQCRYGDVWLVVTVDGHITYWISLNPGLRLHTPLIPYRDQTLSPS